MAEPLVPDVVVNICHNCIPEAGALPRQWQQGEHLVVVRELPCSGKIDVQYLMHALEDVGRGVCIVACEAQNCRLVQGSRRAEVRVRTVQRLLEEIGLEPQRAELLTCPAGEAPTRLELRVLAAVRRLCALGQSPLRPPTGARPARDEGARQRAAPAPGL